MELLDKITDYKSDFITVPKTFENYKWFNPILVFIIGFIITFIGMFIIEGLLHITGLKACTDPIVQDIIGTFTLCVFIPAVYIGSKIVEKRPFSSLLNLKMKWNWSIYFKTLAVSFIVFIVICAIQSLLNGAQINNKLTIITFLLILIVIPFQAFAEELVFRGFAMQSLGSWFKIPIVAIVIQALIFGVLHLYDVLGLFDVIVAGLIYGFVAWYFDGLEVSSAIHAVNNIIVSLTTGLGLAASTTSTTFEDMLVSFIIMVVVVVVLLILDKKCDWFSS